MTEPKWLTIARGMLGVHEGLGAANNKEVVRLFLDAGHPEIKADSVAWCAAFVGACLKRGGVKNSGSLAARSYEQWGQPLDYPVLGCVAVKHRPGGWLGHVFFVAGASGDYIFGLGGNQDDQVSIAVFNRSDIKAFRWPANMPVPKDPQLPTTVGAARTGVKEA